MNLGQRIATRGTTFSFRFRSEVAATARLRPCPRSGEDTASVVMKSEPIQGNFHDLFVAGLEAHSLIRRRADEGLRVFATHRGVQEIEIIHGVVARGGSAIGLALSLRIGWSHSVCTTHRGFGRCRLDRAKSFALA